MRAEELRTLFGARLRSLRKEKGLSAQDVADYVGTDRSWLWRIESGKFDTSFPMIALLAEALQCDPMDLFVTPGATVRHTIHEYTRHAPLPFNMQIKETYEQELKLTARAKTAARK
ncbi:MAG TPA: helix-turn-helix transcriptional regulator [Casimicrobiaceae bacterium]|nr:helix-turn-helix transcriptional regulator [Casimicrobiaceae bacterium]